MGLRNLLVVVDASHHATTTVEAAVLLAAKHDAHLTGIAAVAPLQIPGYVAAPFGAELQRWQDEAAAEAAGRAEQVFGRAVELAGIRARSEWRAVQGDPTGIVGVAARGYDLVVLGQMDGDADREIAAVRPDELVFACGRPVLMIPHSGRFETIGDTVLVGWDGGREAARAVNDALPILERAREVRIVAVNPRSGPRSGQPGDEPGAHIALHLARHGVRAEAAHIRNDELDPANVLLNTCTDIGADLLVMGAYGRSRLRELVLGGTTRTILGHMTVPVLLSH